MWTSWMQADQIHITNDILGTNLAEKRTNVLLFNLILIDALTLCIIKGDIWHLYFTVLV